MRALIAICVLASIDSAALADDVIVDTEDRCFSDPDDDEDGCPRYVVVKTITCSTVVIPPIRFVAGLAVEPDSLTALDAVAQTLIDNPDITLVEVAGHADERGDDLLNLGLSDRRAEAVTSYLIRKGVDPQRLTPQGYGETQPIDPRHVRSAWAKNRRVDFLILKRT